MTEPKTLDEIAEELRAQLRRGDYLLAPGQSAFDGHIPAALTEARDLGRAEPPLDPEVLMTWYRNHAGFHHLVDAFAVTKLDRVVNEAVGEERRALRKRWAYGDEENGQGVYVEWRGRRFGQGPELWAVTRLSWCLNRSGEWEIEPQPSSRDDAFIARCRWHSMQEALLAALDAREEPTIGQDGPAAEAAREVKGHTEIIDDALDARDSAPAEPGKPE
jgi:hypothetical protein